MARISIDEIKSCLSADGWTLVSEKYQNLDSNLEYRCNKGMQYVPLGKKYVKIAYALFVCVSILK